MQPDEFDILDQIIETENIAVSRSIRELQYLNGRYGIGRWRKRKGIATIQYKRVDALSVQNSIGMRLMALVP